MQPGPSSQDRPQSPPAPGVVHPDSRAPVVAPIPTDGGVLEALDGFAAELREVLAEIDRRVSQATGDLRGQLEAFRTLPGRIAEGLAAIGQAVGEAAAAQAYVDERLERLEAAVGDRLEASTHTEERVTDAMDALREDLGVLRERVEDWGTPRAPARVSKDLEALEERVDGIEGAVREDLVEAVSERMEQTFEMRFEALVKLIESRVRQLTVAAEPEDGRRAGLFRRSAV